MLFILWTFYTSMVAAGYLIEIIFGLLNLTPTELTQTVFEPSIIWNYTACSTSSSYLAAVLLWRFVRTGGR